MPNATFVLKEPSGKNKTLVYLLYRYNGQKLKYSTGQKIVPKYWNEEKQRARETRQFSGYGEFNSLLNNLESRVDTDYRKLLNDNVAPNPELLKKGLDEVLKKNHRPQKLTFLRFINEF